jgi:MtN3 and saliva related transmembrane protein
MLLTSRTRSVVFDFDILDIRRRRSSTFPTQMPEKIHYLGYFAGSLTVLSFLPQVIRTWKTKQARDLSLGMFALLVTASTLWIIYGVIIESWPVIVTNVGMVVLNGALATAKLRYS